MKAIVYVLAILASCGAAFFSFNLSNQFQVLEKERVETIDSDRKVTAEADAAVKEIKDQKVVLATSVGNRESLIQSVDSLKSAENALKAEASKGDEELKVQDEEFAQLDKALREVNDILKGLGSGVTLDTLSEKIKEIEDDKIAKQKKVEELETLSGAAEKALATNRSELDRFAKKLVERSSRISKNSMQAVVTAVNQDWGFLVIGAGSNSGFTPQTALLVERDGLKIGRVRPSSIEPTQTIAEIDLESLSSGVRLQRGDRVILATPSSN